MCRISSLSASDLLIHQIAVLPAQTMVHWVLPGQAVRQAQTVVDQVPSMHPSLARFSASYISGSCASASDFPSHQVAGHYIRYGQTMVQYTIPGQAALHQMLPEQVHQVSSVTPPSVSPPLSHQCTIASIPQHLIHLLIRSQT